MLLLTSLYGHVLTRSELHFKIITFRVRPIHCVYTTYCCYWIIFNWDIFVLKFFICKKISHTLIAGNYKGGNFDILIAIYENKTSHFERVRAIHAQWHMTTNLPN